MSNDFNNLTILLKLFFFISVESSNDLFFVMALMSFPAASLFIYVCISMHIFLKAGIISV